MTTHHAAIIGGGVIGSFIAYFLAQSGRAGSVIVIEPDPTYRLATTPNGAGGVRQLFSQPENIWMSQYSLGFYKAFAETIAVGDNPADIDFEQRGYLFVVGEQGATQLEINFEQQRQLGVQAELLDKTDLQREFPSLGLDDIVLGCLSPEDGTLSTPLVLQGLRRKVESLGVTYVDAKVVGLDVRAGRVKKAMLDRGSSIKAEAFVNAAGPWCSQVADLVGMPMPVEPLCRVKHFWTCDANIEPLPLVKDESGLFFRPQGDGFIGGRPSWEVKPGFNFDPAHPELNAYFADYFERTVQPLLVTRLPAFETAISNYSWTGHYAQNRLDGNMILGPWIGELPNFYVACGFSGHGIMHAPAVGLALSELILDGHYSTMDLSRMSYQRVIDNEPYAEQGII